jgi:hypothetical protein
MIYAASFALLVFAVATVQAVRDEYLVVMRWPVGYFFMERGVDGRYTLFRPVRLPLVVLRYSRLALVARALSLSQRVRSRVSHARVAYR